MIHGASLYHKEWVSLLEPANAPASALQVCSTSASWISHSLGFFSLVYREDPRQNNWSVWYDLAQLLGSKSAQTVSEGVLVAFLRCAFSPSENQSDPWLALSVRLVSYQRYASRCATLLRVPYGSYLLNFLTQSGSVASSRYWFGPARPRRSHHRKSWGCPGPSPSTALYRGDTVPLTFPLLLLPTEPTSSARTGLCLILAPLYSSSSFQGFSLNPFLSSTSLQRSGRVIPPYHYRVSGASTCASIS